MKQKMVTILKKNYIIFNNQNHSNRPNIQKIVIFKNFNWKKFNNNFNIYFIFYKQNRLKNALIPKINYYYFKKKILIFFINKIF